MEHTDNHSVTTEKWNPTDRRYVCFIDIMGFKDMVATKAHSDIYKMMKNIVKFQKKNSTIEWGEKKGLVKTTTYSDSIIVYSLNDSADSLHSIICTVASLTHDLLSEGIPHKGAISIGTMTCDIENSIYFGQPLIDSYLLQEELYFYGVVLHGSVEKEIKKHSHSTFTKEYNCPFKKGRTKHTAIIPIYMFSNEKKYQEKNNILLKSVEHMKFNTSGSLRIYIDSTVEYLNTTITK